MIVKVINKDFKNSINLDCNIKYLGFLGFVGFFIFFVFIWVHQIIKYFIIM